MQIYTPWPKQLTKRKKLRKTNLRIMSKQYANLHTMAKKVNKAEKVEKKI